jgi:hypothetical protein
VTEKPAKKKPAIGVVGKMIEEIRKLMLRSAQESFSREKMSRRNPAIAAGKMQQQQSNGADGQL